MRKSEISVLNASSRYSQSAALKFPEVPCSLFTFHVIDKCMRKNRTYFPPEFITNCLFVTTCNREMFTESDKITEFKFRISHTIVWALAEKVRYAYSRTACPICEGQKNSELNKLVFPIAAPS